MCQITWFKHISLCSLQNTSPFPGYIPNSVVRDGMKYKPPPDPRRPDQWKRPVFQESIPSMPSAAPIRAPHSKSTLDEIKMFLSDVSTCAFLKKILYVYV